MPKKTKEAVTLNVGGIANKLVNKADKTGMVIGAAMAIDKHGREWWADGEGHFMDMINESTRLLLADPHFPNLSHVADDLTTGYTAQAVTKPAIKGYIIGEVADFLGFQQRYAKALKRGAVGAVKGAGLWSLYLHAGGYHSPRSAKANTNPSNPSGGGSTQNPLEGMYR